MTTKTLTTNQPAGYSLNAAYSNLVIDPGVLVGTTASAVGVYSGHVATIANYGTVTSGSTVHGVFLNKVGGSVINGSATDTTAVIAGGSAGVYFYAEGASTTLSNFGTIQGSAANSSGVGLNDANGVVTNGSAADTTAQIKGLGFGVYLYRSAAATVTNFGTIQVSAGNAGVQIINSGGAVTNGSAADVTALITGVYIHHAAAVTVTVTDFGTINGQSNAAVVLGSAADRLIVEQSAVFVGALAGGGGTLELAGGSDTITGLGGAGTMTGATPASFYAFGSYIVGVGADLTLTGTNVLAAGQSLSVAGSLRVAGAVTLASTGDLLVSGAMTNQGTISGGAGVTLTGSGVLTNAAGGVITASAAGHAAVYGYAYSKATVVNFGTIDGAGVAAVQFLYSADRLLVEAGSTVIGAIHGGAGTLELAGGTGTLTGLGGTGTLSVGAAGTFSGFGSYVIDTGSSWTLAGANTVAAGRTLTSHGSLTNNGSFTIAGALIDQGSLANAAGKTLTIANGGTLEAQGVVANAGTIAVASTGSTTDLRILTAGATLTGGGKILLTGAKDRILGLSKTSTLTNVNNTIAGTCIFGAANLLTLVNESKGTIDATGGIMTFDTSGSTVTNAGLMESTTGGLLAVTSTTINQSSGGTLDAAGGMINLTGGSDIIGGVIASTTGWAVRALTGANMLDGTTSTVNLTGTLQVFGGDTLTVVGTINNTGKLNLYGGTVVIGAAGATLLGNGQVNFTASAANAITATAAGATLTNAGNVTFGSGTIGGGTLTLVNQAAGVISNGLSVALTINTGSNTVINAGAIAATAAGGGVTVQSAVNNTGRLIANAGGTLTMNGVVTGAGIGQVNGGELIIAQAFAENVFFLGKGVIELEDSTAYTGKVVGLSNAGTNSLDLTDITFTSGVTKATYSGTTASGTLTVTDGTHTANIKLIGNYTTAGAFVLSSDGHGGTTVIDPTPSTPALLTQAMASFQIGAAANPAGPSPGTSTNLPLVHAHG